MSEDAWYKDGLKFKCTGCGKCCTGAPGYVFLSEEEINNIATHLQLTREAFLMRYTKRVDNRISLVDKRPHYDCIFLEKGRFCSIYSCRPKQCRTYPFWPEIISSREQWQLAAQECEGINHPDASIIPLSEIKAKLDE